MPKDSQVSEALNLLRQWLKSSGLAPGARLPSERALAKELDLTHYSVNRAINRLILDGAVEREGYKLRRAVSTDLAPRAQFTCELVLSQRSIYFASYRKVARELGIRLNVHRWESGEEAQAMLYQLNSAKSEAILFDPPLIYPMSMWEPVARALHKTGIPLVCLGQTVAGVTCILPDPACAADRSVTHLLEQGHRELAFFSFTPRTTLAFETMEAWERRCRLAGRTTSAKRVHFLDSIRFQPEDPRDLARLCVNEWQNVTGLVLQQERFPFESFLEELAHLGRHVPADLSLVNIGHPKNLHSALPVSTMLVDYPVMQETAFMMLRRLHRKREATGILPPPSTLRVEPQFIMRGSTGPVPNAAALPAPPAPRKEPEPPPFQKGWTGLAAELRKELQLASQRPYPLALRAPEVRFNQVDLSSYVNRPLNFRRGWLGDLPLKHFAQGRHILHGVPFEVLGGPRRSDCGAIVFQSTINATGKSRSLPARLRIPIGQFAQSIYVLHGCGYAKHLHRFAQYTFLGGKEELGSVPLITLGQPPPQSDDRKISKFATQANIQDWWPDYPHIDFEHGRMAPIVESEGEEALPRHVYLYTLEWINPRPETKVSFLEISVDAEQATTLGVLAVSVLTQPSS